MSTPKKGEEGKSGVNRAAKHLEVSAGWDLTPEQKAFLQRLVHDHQERAEDLSPSPCSSPSSSTGGEGQGRTEGRNAGARYRRLTPLEEAFVETLLAQAAYKLSRGEAVLATNEQLQQLLEARHGIKLDDECEQLRRLKRQFVTKGKSKASKLELLVMEEEGVRGKPSRYRLTGFAAAFPSPKLPWEE
jgi:hypothetical protein